MSFQYFPLYTGDYLRDTRHLTPTKHGIYLLFLMFCWDQKGPLPLDEQECAGIANCRSADEIDAMRYVIERYFIRMNDGCYNHRMQKEIEKAENVSMARSDAGKKGYQAKAKQLLSKSKASASTIDHRPYTNPNPNLDLNPKPEKPLLTTIVDHSGSIGNFSEKPEKSARATRLPENWFLPKAWGDWALQEGKSRQEIELEANKFRDHWISKAGKDAAKRDWFATWRNWIRNSEQFTSGKSKRNDKNDIEEFVNIITKKG